MNTQLLEENWQKMGERYNPDSGHYLSDVPLQGKDSEGRVFFRGILQEMAKARELFILDCGCATGVDYSSLREVPNIKYQGIDWTSKFIQQALITFGEDAPFQVGSILNIPFEDRAFDLVYERHVLEHLQDLEDMNKALAEMARVTKKHLVLIFASAPGDHTVIRTHDHKGIELPTNVYSRLDVTSCLSELGFTFTVCTAVGGDTIYMCRRVEV